MSLTKHPPGSLGELWKISYPLMLSFLSVFMMIFVDRIFLSHYSTAALNAATKTGTLAWAFTVGLQALVSISTVFVAQYNGARQYNKIGEPVWQMIWVSIASLAFFWPMGYFGGKLLYPPNTLEYQYFMVALAIGPLCGIYHSLTTFFIGRGKTLVITKLALAGNLINVILDPLLIFGYKSYIPSMGMRGAIIATAIGITSQIVILAILFLSEQNNKTFNTWNYRFNLSAMKRCFKVGLPPSLFETLELIGWAIFYHMMAFVSEEHILTASISQSVLLPFYFFCFGIEKGVSTIAGNLIGAKQAHLISKLMKSGLKLICVFMVFVSIFFLGLSEPIIHFFLNGENLSPTMLTTLKTALALAEVYLLFEVLRMLVYGALVAAGDSLVPVVAGISSMWLFLLMPTYFLIVQAKGSVYSSMIIWVIYSIIMAAWNYLRFAQGKWKKKQLI
jgi:multidrug resistance protein, MATE family